MTGSAATPPNQGSTTLIASTDTGARREHPHEPLRCSLVSLAMRHVRKTHRTDHQPPPSPRMDPKNETRRRRSRLWRHHQALLPRLFRTQGARAVYRILAILINPPWKNPHHPHYALFTFLILEGARLALAFIRRPVPPPEHTMLYTVIVHTTYYLYLWSKWHDPPVR